MSKSRIIGFLLALFIVADFTFSFFQYYNTPLYGDLASHVLPDKVIKPVFDDPFGFQLLKTGKRHANPNRFFAHWSVAAYFQHVPLWLQNFVNPINSVYLASAIAKILVQLLFIYIVAFFITGTGNPARKKFLIAAGIVIPLFQVYGYWSRLGIVDQSIVYTFFYALPLVLTMLYFLPVFNRMVHHKKIRFWQIILLTPLMIILPLSGPLIAPVVIIVSFFIILNFIIRAERKEPVSILKSIPKSFYFLLIPLNLVSFYSIFLGFFNANYAGKMISLAERFALLPEGLNSQIFHSLGFPLILLFTGLNIFLIKKNQFEGSEKILRILKWIGIFALLYILLLPFGGYRPYRARIIRYDTFMPITISVIYFFGASTWFLVNHFRSKRKRNYIAGLIAVLLILTMADLEGLNKNLCERMALKKMADSTEKVVALPKDCFVLDWENNYTPEETEKEAKLIHYWNITSEKKLYFNEK